MLAGLALNALGTALSNKMAEGATENARSQNYMYNEMAASNAYNRQKDFYERYQSPLARVKQLQEAGMSTSIMASGGVPSGNGATAPTGAGANGIQPNRFGIAPIDAANLELIQAQTRKTNAEANTEEGNSEKGKAQIAQMLSEAGYKKAAEELVTAETYMQNIKNAIANATSVDQMEQIKEQAETMYWNAQHAQWAAENAHLEYKFNDETFETRVNQTTANLRETLAKITDLFADAKVKEKNVQYMQTQMDNIVNMFGLELRKHQLNREKFWEESNQFYKKFYQEAQQFAETMEFKNKELFVKTFMNFAKSSGMLFGLGQ